jgi:divalent metal cation (Fe/Co/Zn/Cd) transporter
MQCSMRELSLEEAHSAVERLEQRVCEEVPELRYVHTHIEPLARTDWASAPDTGDTAIEREAIESAVRERCPGLADVIVHTEPMGAEAR